MNVRRLLTGAPFVQILAVFVERLDPMIRPIVHKNAPRLRIDGDAVDVIEIPRPFVIRWISFLAPVEKELAVLVELRHACSVVAVRDEHRAVREPGEESRTIEVRAVGAGHLRSADGLYQ